jgi:hypothetical protein
MARRKTPPPSEDWLFPKTAMLSESDGQSSLLDVIDNVLNKGAVLNGDLVLGVANVDLIYAKLSVLLAALDRVMKPDTTGGARRKDERSRRKRTSRRRRK